MFPIAVQSPPPLATIAHDNADAMPSLLRTDCRGASVNFGVVRRRNPLARRAGPRSRWLAAESRETKRYAALRCGVPESGHSYARGSVRAGSVRNNAPG